MKTWSHAGMVVLTLLMPALMGGCGEADEQALITKAERYLGKQEHKAAIIELKNVLLAHPASAQARYLLGVAHNETGDHVSAEKELRKALELNYDRRKATVALGKALLPAGEYGKVLDEIRDDVGADKRFRAEVLTLRAQASIGLRRVHEARGLLKEALGLDPKLPEALVVEAALAAGEGRRDEAGRLVAQAIESDPAHVGAWLMKGDLHRANNDAASAKAAYRKVIEINHASVPARLNIALLESAAGNFEVARNLVTEARTLAPGNVMALYMQALVAFQERKYPQARDAVLQVLKHGPGHLPSLLLAGAVEYALGSYAQAQSHLERVVQRSPDNLYARLLLAETAAKLGQVDRAIQVLEPGLKQAPQDSAVLALAGELHMARNDFAKAAHYFESAAQGDAKNATLRTRLGESRFALGETERAFADLESAVRLDTGDHRADVALVVSYLRKAKHDQALEALKSLERKQPENPLTYNLKGLAYAGKSDTAGARKQFERALELRPGYVPAAVNLAQLDLRDKNPAAARRRLEALLEKDAENGQVLLALASLGERIGASDEQRVAWLERAAKAMPDTLEPRIMLARHHIRKGDTGKALDLAQRVRATNPNHPQALELLGAAQTAAGQKQQALSTYGNLAAVQPESPRALLRLARAQAAYGNTADAITTLNKALKLRPDLAPAQISLVYLYASTGRFADASRMAQRVQKQSPKEPTGFVLEGDVLMAQKKTAQALKAYEAAYAVRKSAALVVKLHSVYMQAGRHDEGKARIADWLTEFPEDNAVRLYMAGDKLKRGDLKSAIEDYEMLLKKLPDNVIVLNNLAWAYHRVNDARALETAERAYKLGPDSAPVADTLGWILVQHASSARGLELLQKAASAAPNSPGIRYHLAYASYKAGDTTRARTELERLLAMKVDFDQQAEARKLLEQLRR